MKAILLALALMLVAPSALALGTDMDAEPKTKTILAGPGAKKSSTIGALKKLAQGTKIKGVGIRTKLGKGISARVGIRKNTNDKPGMNILGGRRGTTKGRGAGPRFEFKIKF